MARGSISSPRNPCGCTASPDGRSTRSGGATAWARARGSRARRLVVREEQRRAVDLVAGDGLLSRGRGKPVDEFLTPLAFDGGVPLGVHQHHAVLIEKPFVALDQ